MNVDVPFLDFEVLIVPKSMCVPISIVKPVYLQLHNGRSYKYLNRYPELTHNDKMLKRIKNKIEMAQDDSFCGRSLHLS